MLAIYHETHTRGALKSDDYWIRHSEMFILIELLVFFGQILCSTFFILGIQIRGELGYDNDPLHQRFKFDMLTYYKDDIGWFSFGFVCLTMHIWFVIKHAMIPSKEDNDMKQIYSSYMVMFNLIRLYLVMPYRSADRSYRTITDKAWAILFILEIIGASMIFAFKNIKGSNTFSASLIDALSLFGQLIIYKSNEIYLQE